MNGVCIVRRLLLDTVFGGSQGLESIFSIPLLVEKAETQVTLQHLYPLALHSSAHCLNLCWCHEVIDEYLNYKVVCIAWTKSIWEE